MSETVAVIVTYRPERDLLLQLCQALASQVSGGIIINNGSTLPIPDDQFAQFGLVVEHLHCNVGVATALNAGFSWAAARGAEFVVTFDQDSEPTAAMVQSLMGAYLALLSEGCKVGAVGPQQIDRRTGRKAPFLAPISGLRHKIFPTAGQIVEVDHLITSGCLAPIAAWADTGGFLAPLFIDYVDIEWSLHLRHRGWHLFAVGSATLIHAMGEDIWQVAGRHIARHSPLRHYCMFRNGIYLQKLTHISRAWKIADLILLTKKLFLFTLLDFPHLTHLRDMVRGIRDGWQERMGSPPASHQNADSDGA